MSMFLVVLADVNVVVVLDEVNGVATVVLDAVVVVLAKLLKASAETILLNLAR